MAADDPRAVWSGRAAALFALLLLAYFVAAALRQTGGADILVSGFGASESLGFRLSFRLDGLSILFGVLITGIGALIFTYGGHYLAGRADARRAIVFLLLFMLAMLGVTMAENLIALFVFWELTSITSWLLIGLDHQRTAARDASLQALLVTGGGGMAMLAGIIMLGSVAGTYELSGIAAQADAIRAHALYVPILLLIVLGAFTKSAQVPFHFWLPAAMEAPTPVSAYLHSATMVKAGVYLLARLLSTLGGSNEWMAILVIFGTATMLIGAVMAVMATDLKRILAYSTMSALGSLVLILGIGTPAAAQAAVVFLIAHALYKAALFLVAGIVDHETGTRDVERLGGLRRAMPLTATAGIVGALSLASFGPVLSFAGKEMFVLATAGVGEWATLLQAVVYTAAMLLASAAALVALRPFFGEAREKLPAHDPPPGMWFPPVLLALAGIALGIFPGTLTKYVLGPAAAAIHPAAINMKVELWHGINAPLLFAAAATAAGLILYRTRTAWLRAVEPLRAIGGYGPTAAYRAGLTGTIAFAARFTRVLQTGFLRTYLLIIMVTTIGLATAAVALVAPLRFNLSLADVTFYEVAISLLIVAGGIVAVRSQSRLGSVAALGVVGYSVAIIYILFSAPDLAMTQFLIETLTVIIFILVIYRLPRYARLTKPAARTRDIVVSLIAGGVMCTLVLAATSSRVAPVLSTYYAENSAEAAHGRNIVNVILVDFRALDTLGEITVLAVAATGVFALLRLRPTKRGKA